MKCLQGPDLWFISPVVTLFYYIPSKLKKRKRNCRDQHCVKALSELQVAHHYAITLSVRSAALREPEPDEWNMVESPPIFSWILLTIQYMLHALGFRSSSVRRASSRQNWYILKYCHMIHQCILMLYQKNKLHLNSKWHWCNLSLPLYFTLRWVS